MATLSSHSGSPDAPSARLSVIMRSKNAGWVIDQSLAALFAQEGVRFDLLVVDSGSTDRTLECVGKFPARLHQIPARDYFPGAVLNEAIARTEGDILVFQNSDAVPLTPHTLRRLIQPFQDPGVAAAFARQVPRPGAHTWVRRDYAVSFPASGPAPDWMPYSLPLAAMRRAAWIRQPFPTDTWGSEDTAWGFQARQNGRRIQYVPEAAVMHSHNYTLRQLYGRRFIEGEADAFIHRDRLSSFSLLSRVFRATLRNGLDYLREKDFRGLPGIPARCWVHHWAYFKGHRHGELRRQTGNPDASTGQRAVLDRYEP